MAEAEHVSVVDVVTPELGVMETLPIVGAVFETVTESESSSVPPSASVAVTEQVMVSSGELVELVSVRLVPEPSSMPVLALNQV